LLTKRIHIVIDYIGSSILIVMNTTHNFRIEKIVMTRSMSPGGYLRGFTVTHARMLRIDTSIATEPIVIRVVF